MRRYLRALRRALRVALVTTVLNSDDILAAINQAKGEIMASLDDVNAKLGELGPKVTALGTAVNGLEQKIADALASENISAATQAKIDAAFQSVSDMVTEAQAAIDDAAVQDASDNPTP